MLDSLISRLTISKKIQCLFLPALFLLAMTALYFMGSSLYEISVAKDIKQLTVFADKLDAVAHNHAVERGLTAGYLGKANTEIKHKLDIQRINADLATKNFKTFILNHGKHLKNYYDNDIKQINDKLEAIPNLRKKIDEQADNIKAFSVYSNVNKASLDLLSKISIQIINRDVLMWLH